MIELPDLATGGLAVGMLSALALGGGLLRAQRQQARQRAEIAALRRKLDAAVRVFTAEVEHLTARRVPASARQLAHPHVTVPGPLHSRTAGTPLGLALEHVHENEQSLRRAQVAAVVCGAWVGLAREESHLVDAVAGGQARLAGYHRVRIHNHLEAGPGSCPTPWSRSRSSSPNSSTTPCGIRRRTRTSWSTWSMCITACASQSTTRAWA